VVNTYAVLNPHLIKELADEYGSQSVIVSLDVRRGNSGEYCIYINSGRRKVDVNLLLIIEQLISNGAGEIMVTSIDNEGVLSGFDYDLYKSLRTIVSVPLIASGGAGCYDHKVKLFRETDCDACAIGKMLFLRDYDIVRIKSYLKGKKILMRDA